MRPKSLYVAFALGVTIAGGTAFKASADIITNGDFGGGTYTVGTNPNVPVGWTPNTGFLYNSSWDSVQTGTGPSGGTTTFLSIGNDDNQTNPQQPVAGLSQTLTDVSGTQYIVSFYAKYGGFPTSDPYPFLTMTAASGSITLDPSTPNSWNLYTFTFTGTGSDTLDITAQTTPSDWFVDDISVAPSGVAATPLPAALPLFAGGLGALGLLGWRKSRHAAV
jgi:hypothetical protein